MGCTHVLRHVQVGDVVFDHCYMLTLAHLRRRATSQGGGFEPWHFEQHQDEAVFIPAGCPHQVCGVCVVCVWRVCGVCVLWRVCAVVCVCVRVCVLYCCAPAQHWGHWGVDARMAVAYAIEAAHSCCALKGSLGFLVL